MGSATMVADDGIEGDQLDAIDSDDMDCDDEDNRQYIAKRLEVGYAFTDPHDPRMQQARELRKQSEKTTWRVSRSGSRSLVPIFPNVV
ncbi:hypothetical protein G6F68_020542 [Rhizopus microsporus]|nr:hypothetical protein G6F68_020542 [Rhizopus microsporus]